MASTSTPERARRELRHLHRLRRSVNLRTQEQAMIRATAAFAITLLGLTAGSIPNITSMAFAALVGVFFASILGRTLIKIASIALLVIMASDGAVPVPQRRRRECDIRDVRWSKLDAMIAEREAILTSTART